MVIEMKDPELLVSCEIEGLHRYLLRPAHIRFRRHSRAETYPWTERVLLEFKYADFKQNNGKEDLRNI